MTPPVKPETQYMITQKSGMSIALVVVIVTGIVANLAMVYSLHADVLLVNHKIADVADDTAGMRGQLTDLSKETRTEIRSIRSELSGIRVDVAELKAR